MRLLAFSDLHRNSDRAGEIARASADADVVVGVGDFATLRLGLGRVISELRAITCPTVLVPGNHESERALRRECRGWEAATVLHGEGCKIGGIPFFGLGGAIPPAPFPWSWNVEEEYAAEALARCPDGAVLVVHSPPQGHLDRAMGRNLGSAAILAAIERSQPRLVLCGHIHQCWGQEATIGGSQVLNLGPEGAVVEL